MREGLASLSRESKRPDVVLLLPERQLWWTYLATISNPQLCGFSEYDNIVFTDSLNKLKEFEHRDPGRTKFFFIFWDGIPSCAELSADMLNLARTLDVTVLLVGFNRCPSFLNVRPLYSDGPLLFRSSSVLLDRQSKQQILRARIKHLLMPARNILRRSGSLMEALELLVGKAQVVFCGGYGLSPKLIAMFDARYRASPKEFADRIWSSQKEYARMEDYIVDFWDDVRLLLEAFETGQLAEDYFIAAVRLMGRSYMLRHLRFAKFPLFTNQFSDFFVDVYSTPFYNQHIFLDFGSTITASNYPRIADLRYFDKQVVTVVLMDSAPTIAASIASGTHVPFLEDRWNELRLTLANLI